VKNRMKEWRANNPEKASEYNRTYYANNREKIREYQNSEKFRESQRNHYKRNREKRIANSSGTNAMYRSAISTLKIEAGCVDCGYNEHPEALHFDHIEDNKTNGIAQLSLYPALEEIEKCEVRCANCHAIKTRRTWKGGRPRTVTKIN